MAQTAARKNLYLLSSQEITKESLAAAFSKFQTTLAANKGEDLLSPWVDYINWLDSLPEETAVDEALRDCITQCCRKIFKEDTTKKYYDDERFIQIWFKLAELSNPLKTFEYMLGKKVGTKSVNFYLTWAKEAESLQGAAEAQKILQMSFEACAGSEGFPKLFEALKELNQRMYSSQSNSVMCSSGYASSTSSQADSKSCPNSTTGSVGSNSSQPEPLSQNSTDPVKKTSDRPRMNHLTVPHAVDSPPSASDPQRNLSNNSDSGDSLPNENLNPKRKPRDSLFMKRYDKLHHGRSQPPEETKPVPSQRPTTSHTARPQEDLVHKVVPQNRPVTSHSSRATEVTAKIGISIHQEVLKPVESSQPKEKFVWNENESDEVSIEEALAARRRSNVPAKLVDPWLELAAAEEERRLREKVQKLVEVEGRTLMERRKQYENKLVDLETKEKKLDNQLKDLLTKEESLSHLQSCAETIARSANRLLHDHLDCLEDLCRGWRAEEVSPFDYLVNFFQSFLEKINRLEQAYSGSERQEVLSLMAARCEELLLFSKDLRIRASSLKPSRMRSKNDSSAFADVSSLTSRDSNQKSNTTKSSLPVSATSMSEQSNPCIKAMWNQTTINDVSRFRPVIDKDESRSRPLSDKDDGYVSERRTMGERVSEPTSAPPVVRQAIIPQKPVVIRSLPTCALNDPENMPIIPKASQPLCFEIFEDLPESAPYLPVIPPKEDVKEPEKPDDDDSENTPPPESKDTPTKQKRRSNGVLNDSLEHPAVPSEALTEKDFVEVPPSDSEAEAEPEKKPVAPAPVKPNPRRTNRVSTLYGPVPFDDVELDLNETRRKSIGWSDQTLPLVSQSEFCRQIDLAKNMASTPLIPVAPFPETMRHRQSRISYIPPNGNALSPIHEGSREKSSSSSSGATTWMRSTKKSMGIYSPVKEHEEISVIDPHSVDLLYVLRERLLENLQSEPVFKQLTDASLKEPFSVGTQLRFQTHRCTISEFIGKGTFSSVFCIRSITDTNLTWAVKTQPKDGWWSYYIHSEALRRAKTLPDAEVYNELLLPLLEFQETRDGGSYTFMPLCSHGTLAKLAAMCQRTADKVIPEPIALKFAVDILRAVEALHLSNLIHGDIKASNFYMQNLTRFDEAKNTKSFMNLAAMYLADFNLGIDLSLFDGPVAFISERKSKGVPGWEILSSCHWTFLVDYLGILDIFHLMLFGEPMKIVKENNAWKIVKNFKASLHPIWSATFDKFLNLPLSMQGPETISVLRREFEEAAVNRLEGADLTKLMRKVRVAFFVGFTHGAR